MPHQIRMSTPELEHFQAIRDLRILKKEVKPQNEYQANILNQTLHFFGWAGDQRLGSWEISAANAIHELATIGRDVMRKIQSEDWVTGRSENVPDLMEDHGPLTDLEEPANGFDGVEQDESVSWESIKSIIPSFVKQISFSVDESAMQPGDLEDLRQRFPGVTVCPPKRIPTPPPETAADTPKASGTIEKPRGIRTAVFIVDPNELHRSTEIAANVKTRFPWASIRRGTASTAKPSLLDRMSRDEFRIKVAASPSTSTAEPGPANSVTLHHSSSDSIPSTIQRDPVEDTIDRVQKETGAAFTHPHALESMYSAWLSSRKMTNYCPRKGVQLEHYNQVLVDLAIIANHTHDADLEYSVLWNWQKTNYTRKGDVPSPSAAVKAFQHLPHTSDLCGWITVFYSYLWTTRKSRSYELLREECQDCDPESIGAFLFEIAATRCPQTQGGNVPVLEAWCDFHHHKQPRDEAKCKAARDKAIKVSLAREKQDLEAIQLQRSTDMVVDHGGVITWPKKRKHVTPPPRDIPAKSGRIS
ncbi:uncharacterized protein EI97DRAFT_482764 [Westerdykella ornata]|uniref:Uncharacterized protein n=1 Tax=Westerdykella ornata TaxID=318751 RepID=A0A6A6JD63_WESOR|nr:uncharacterized protein EI97DRAFT_482764 [Westerdykella ornata]KAF2273129.1 hypothetical protein EI97DRAFT_482764 [Westerdykella ornata]